MMEFIADSMLSKLARWLRMFGFRAEPAGAGEDDEIIRQAMRKKKTLLTKDEKMHEKAKDYVKTILIRGNCLDQQLLQFFKAAKQDLDNVEEKNIPNPHICSICNGNMKKISRKEAGKRGVPEKSLESATKFFRCTRCKKMFWNGSHNAKILEKYWRIRRLLAKRRAF